MTIKLSTWERFVTLILAHFPSLMSLVDMLKKLYFLAPHDRDYLALKSLFKEDQHVKILDIGANIGQSSIGFKKIFPNSSIHAIEANPELGGGLFKLQNAGVIKHVTICFIGSHIGEKMKLFVPKLHGHSFSTFASLDLLSLTSNLQGVFPKRILTKFTFHEYENPIITLDSLEIDTVDLIKIDVEGFERLVLDGAVSLIKRCSPVIFLEINSVEHFISIEDFALRNEYKLLTIDNRAFSEISQIDFACQKSRNYLLINSKH